MTVSTGANVSATASGSTPWLEILAGAASGSSGPFGFSSAVSGIQLTTPAGVVSDGTYNALVVLTGQSFVIPFEARGGVLTERSSSGGNVPVIIAANTQAAIALYQRGFTPAGP